MKKILKGVKLCVDIVLTVFILAFVLSVCLQRFSNNEISFFSYRMFTVVSGSMVPDYEIGDVLIAKEIEPSEIKVGDDVSYLGKAGSFNGKVVTHRVIEKGTDTDGRFMFRTQGIANPDADPVIYEDQIYGVVVGEFTLLSFVYKCISTKTGMFFFIVVPIFYILGSEMLSFLLEKEEKRRNKIKEEKKEIEEKKVKKAETTKVEKTSKVTKKATVRKKTK